jgi:ATP-binding cassette, subfamily B, multidrug efflux pump
MGKDVATSLSRSRGLLRHGRGAATFGATNEIKNAPILFLDEATSALDSEVEAAIQEQLEGLMKGRTVIAIAHRLSTIARMDRLIVLDHGRIVEQGAHAELLAANGAYARLWRRQSGAFLREEAAAAAE